MKIPFLDLSLSHAPYLDELQAAACRVIAGGRYLHGSETERLEHEMARLCQVEHCVAVSNGLDALRLTLRAYIEMGQLRPGNKVIVPANTYIATVLAVSDNRLVPVLCDIDETTMNLDSRQLEAAIDRHVRAVMPVHLYGTPCWDSVLVDLAQKHQLLVIEDNAQAVSARAACPGMNGTHVTGGLGHAAGISFYPTKNLGALGDGGAVVTNDHELSRTVSALANYGSDRRYHNIYSGCNCRMDEIQAALLRVKLRHFEQENQVRRQVAAEYGRLIKHPLVKTPAIFTDMRQVWHQYVVCVAGGRRDAFREHLADNGVGTDIHYSTPPHRQPCYRDLAHGPLPATERLAGQVVSLPIAPPVTPATAAQIAEIINDFPG